MISHQEVGPSASRTAPTVGYSDESGFLLEIKILAMPFDEKSIGQGQNAV